jgi:site-specific recombinase XerD
MAHIYKVANSPYWWLNWMNPDFGRRKRFSTKLRHDNPVASKKARMMLAEYQMREISRVAHQKEDHWHHWVPHLIRIRHGKSPDTYRRSNNEWNNLYAYFIEIEIQRPADLTRQHCYAYVDWRMDRPKKLSINTVLMELGTLRVIMGEAIARNYCTHNPASNLKIQGAKPRPRPELSDTEIEAIRKHVQSKRQNPQASEDVVHALEVSFEIALHQGCRLAETFLEIHRDVDLERRAIRFHAKGDRYYETALHPKLIPLFERLRKEGRETSYAKIGATKLSQAWWDVFNQLGFKHLCFHCLRVTAISRLERAGAPETAVMQLVNHASTTIHRIYRRHTSHELSKYFS